ncbi:hypothetical protein EG68_03521 [Paragonimus skrjabini miyazakii]|uniref:Uncharacterized protein n=1 Tax=Paragonimus skrjabini miyazakii TaxID=59628 RepID=A0A8S9YW84_9TREM|nr:hypothetical protein EG68_03521 [Paragonimus skrjabini miyazakii]
MPTFRPLQRSRFGLIETMNLWNSYSHSASSNKPYSCLSRILLPCNRDASRTEPHHSRKRQSFRAELGISPIHSRRSSFRARSHSRIVDASGNRTSPIPTLFNFRPDPVYSSSVFKPRAKNVRSSSIKVESHFVGLSNRVSDIERGVRMLESKKRSCPTFSSEFSPIQTKTDNDPTAYDAKRRCLGSAATTSASPNVSALGNDETTQGFHFTSIGELRRCQLNGYPGGNAFTVPSTSSAPVSAAFHGCLSKPFEQKNGPDDPVTFERLFVDSSSVNDTVRSKQKDSQASVRRRIPYMSPAELEALFQIQSDASTQTVHTKDSSSSESEDFDDFDQSLRRFASRAPSESVSRSVDTSLFCSPLKQPCSLAESSTSSFVELPATKPATPHRVGSVARFIANLDARDSKISPITPIMSVSSATSCVSPSLMLNLSTCLSPSDMSSRVARIRTLLGTSSGATTVPAFNNAVSNVVSLSFAPSPLSSASSGPTFSSSASGFPPLPFKNALPPTVSEKSSSVTVSSSTPVFGFSFPPIVTTTTTASSTNVISQSAATESLMPNQSTVSSSTVTSSFPVNAVTAVPPVTTTTSLSSFGFPTVIPTTTMVVSAMPFSLHSIPTFSAPGQSVIKQPPTTVSLTMMNTPSVIAVTSGSVPILGANSTTTSTTSIGTVTPFGFSAPVGVTSSASIPLTCVSSTNNVFSSALTGSGPTNVSAGQLFNFTSSPCSTVSKSITSASGTSAVSYTQTTTPSFCFSGNKPAPTGSSGVPLTKLFSGTSPATSAPVSTAINTLTSVSSAFQFPQLTSPATTITSETKPTFSFPNIGLAASTTPFSLSSTASVTSVVTSTIGSSSLFSFGSSSKSIGSFTFTSPTSGATSLPPCGGTATTVAPNSTPTLSSFATGTTPNLFVLGMKPASVSKASSTTATDTLGSTATTTVSWFSNPPTSSISWFGGGSVTSSLGGTATSSLPSTNSSGLFSFGTPTCTGTLTSVATAPSQLFQFGSSNPVTTTVGNTGITLVSPASASSLFMFGQQAQSANPFQPTTTTTAINFQFGGSAASTPSATGFNFMPSSSVAIPTFGATQPQSTGGFVFGQSPHGFTGLSSTTSNPFAFGSSPSNPAAAGVAAPRRRPAASRRMRRP